MSFVTIWHRVDRLAGDEWDTTIQRGVQPLLRQGYHLDLDPPLRFDPDAGGYPSWVLDRIWKAATARPCLPKPNRPRPGDPSGMRVGDVAEFNNGVLVSPMFCAGWDDVDTDAFSTAVIAAGRPAGTPDEVEAWIDEIVGEEG